MAKQLQFAFVYPVVLPFFQEYAYKKLGMSNTIIGLILSTSPAAQIVTSFIWTALQTSPHVGRKACLVLGLVVLSLVWHLLFHDGWSEYL